MAMAVPGLRRVAMYLRVSSDEQAERGTIRVQRAELRRRLESDPTVMIVGEYADDGVKSEVPLSERPGGARLLADARRRLIDEVHVYKLDRLGRTLIGLALAREALTSLNVRIISALEGEPDDFMFDIQSAVAANERRVFLRRSADGMAEAARQGRYCGGIVPFGYRVEGQRETARLAPDEAVLCAGQSPAAIVRWIYDRLALDHWSCPRIAAELNARGVPTHYARDDRLVKRDNRKERTQGLWRASRIRNLVINAVYRGELSYGRRTAKRGRTPITAPCLPLVSAATWHAAQHTLAANRVIAKNTRRRYLMRGTIRCGICGLAYLGSRGRGDVGWYRCGGQLRERGPIEGRCWGQSIRTDALEPMVWADVERWLRDPGEALDDLQGGPDRGAKQAVEVAESITLASAMDALDRQRVKALDLNVRNLMNDAELEAVLGRIAGERTALEARVAALAAPEGADVPEVAPDLLAELRARLDAGLTDEQRQEIVGLLVRVVIATETATEGRRKTAKATVEYRFPGVVNVSTGTGSSRPRT